MPKVKPVDVCAYEGPGADEPRKRWLLSDIKLKTLLELEAWYAEQVQAMDDSWALINRAKRDLMRPGRVIYLPLP